MLPQSSAQSAVRKLVSHVEELSTCLSRQSSEEFSPIKLHPESFELTDEELQRVVHVQRLYRLKKHVYRWYGGRILSDGTGKHLSGRITFETSPQVAQWVKVSKFTNLFRLSSYMSHTWQLAKPDVLITVAGGHEDFDLPPRLIAALASGLASATAAVHAWIITGGSDTGVMKLVGDIRQRNDINAPLIGFVPWGVVHEREVLASEDVYSSLRAVGGGRPRPATYKRYPPTAEGIPLSPQHTHFVLVDTFCEGAEAWGSEIPLRVAIEAWIAQEKSVPGAHHARHKPPTPPPDPRSQSVPQCSRPACGQWQCRHPASDPKIGGKRDRVCRHLRQRGRR